MSLIHSHPLSLGLGEFTSRACGYYSETDPYYRCGTCGEGFHKECAESSLEITHPYHPRHPLEILPCDPHDTSRTCHWCKRWVGSHFYHCDLCNFNLHLFCAAQQPLLEIEPPVRIHEHKLTLFPREIYFTCNACGESGVSFSIYVCLPCDFMVHRGCLRLPSVIRISRHEHRIYRVPYLRPGQWVCGICHKDVDAMYGAFLCTKTKDCSYVAHSKCATTDDVWDGKELEGVPEEEDEITGVEPYEVINEVNPRIIRHFSHGDHLRLIEDSNGCDEDKRCQACTLPVNSGSSYHCVEVSCDFILHEECANLPRKRRHGLLSRFLVLQAEDISSDRRRGFFFCSTCSRFCCGFKYVGKAGFLRRLTLDVLCASISEPLYHKGHREHGPLYLKSWQYPGVTCSACKESSSYVLWCLQCNFLLCFKCATLPDTVNYKYDQHPLTLCYGEDANDPYWCEVCEKQMDPTIWFYTCNHCCVTAHVECILGSSPYAKPGRDMRNCGSGKFDIVPNSRINRPLCHECDRRCQDAVVFKRKYGYFCSTNFCNIEKMYFD